MTGLRGSDLDSDGGDEGSWREVKGTDGDSSGSPRLTPKGRRASRRQKREMAHSMRVASLEQRVSMLEELLDTVTEDQAITVTRESGEWFAHDPETGCAGNGETRAQAIAQLAEAIAHETGKISFSDEFAADVEAGRRQIGEGETQQDPRVEILPDEREVILERGSPFTDVDDDEYLSTDEVADNLGIELDG